MSEELDVLRPEGRLDSDSSPEFAKRALEMIEKGSRRLLIDLKDLYYISSAGLRAALQISKRMDEVGGRFAVCSAEPEVAQVFDIGGFLSVVGLHSDLESAKAELMEQERGK
jgi:anti-anti-sigma factor